MELLIQALGLELHCFMKSKNNTKAKILKYSKKYIFGIFLGILIYLIFIYIINVHDCNNLENFKKHSNDSAIKCSRGYFISIGARSPSTRIAYLKNGILDTADFSFGCGDWAKLTSYDHNKKYYILYKEGLDYVLLVRSLEEFKLLKEIYPDSAKLVDEKEFNIMN